ncbi:type II secretion system protein GspL [Marinobacter daepoensis]|uniref:Type II secretion system protein L n=1 Tax=Marinobacter daepoensis TaxID=262077 RepID=A0ABS3BB92_9GAMM|nr:type II secretion system protein GspL [Marinobacter daepoensis]MBN7769119.1 type II secretion system protein GspL [Marinobacter daepoensis]MBY6077809.1 type II secretion system protein GspL [Marinobacter daepoensis]
MSYRLFVRPVPPYMAPDQSPDTQLFSWVLQDAGGDAQARGEADTRENIEQTLAQNALEKVLLIGLVPGDEAVFCVADIPARQNRFIQQALPYAVEEQVAQDIDSVHLALGPHTPDGYLVAGIDREQMAHWRELFDGWYHTQLEAIYPDAALLPVGESAWAICLDGDFAILRSQRGEWLRMQASNLPMLAVTLAAPSSDEVVAEIPVTLYGSETELESSEALVSELAGSTGHMRLEKKPLEFSSIELLAWSHYQHLCEPINLCQGPFSPKREGSSPLKPWKPLIAVASLWFVIQMGLEIGMGVYQQKQADQLEAQAMTIYRKAFPSDRRTHAGNVRRVIEGQLRMAGSQGPEVDFITLMKYTGDQYGRLQNPGAVTFNSINYSRSRGELVVDIRVDSYDRLSRLRNGLSNAGLQAQIGSVVNESSGARGRLTVSGG